MTGKIILSRKGFDSGYGGMPSAFVSGGEMASFPIPHKAERFVDPEVAGYDDLVVEGASLLERIRMLKGDAFASKFDRCGHDPDLRRGIFGQAGVAQSHLHRHAVGKGDLFLFFGWFREAEWRGATLRFRRPHRDVQALFGFLQIGEILPAEVVAQEHPEFRDHPHLTTERLGWDQKDAEWRNNTVYLAAEKLSFAGVESALPGFGVFRHSPELVLTADGAESRTIWKLPDIFRGREITYHTGKGKNPWRPDGLFQSRPRGQEFVVDADDKIREWALDRIRSGMQGQVV